MAVTMTCWKLEKSTGFVRLELRYNFNDAISTIASMVSYGPLRDVLKRLQLPTTKPCTQCLGY